MSDKIKKPALRLNLEREIDRKVWEILNNIDSEKFRSMNDYLIKAVIEYDETLKIPTQNLADIIKKELPLMQDEIEKTIIRTIATELGRNSTGFILNQSSTSNVSEILESRMDEDIKEQNIIEESASKEENIELDSDVFKFMTDFVG